MHEDHDCELSSFTQLMQNELLVNYNSAPLLKTNLNTVIINGCDCDCDCDWTVTVSVTVIVTVLHLTLRVLPANSATTQWDQQISFRGQRPLNTNSYGGASTLRGEPKGTTFSGECHHQQNFHGTFLDDQTNPN